MIRGGHLDLCVLGAFQVAENGDIANWATSENDTAPAVGGAMDLAAGAKRLWVMMEHTTKDGTPQAGAPLLLSADRGRRGEARLHQPRGDRRHRRGFVVLDMAPGLTFDALAEGHRRAAAHGGVIGRASSVAWYLISYSVTATPHRCAPKDDNNILTTALPFWGVA